MSDENSQSSRKTTFGFHPLGPTMRLRYAVIDPSGTTPSFTLLTIPGLGETIEKKDFELGKTIADLNGRHIVYEPRGQGASSRFLDGAHKLRAFVPSFETYLDDVNAIFAEIVIPQAVGPIFVNGHSTGGLTLLSWLVSKGPPLRAAIVTAPALSLSMPSHKILPSSNFHVPVSVALTIAKLFVAFGNGSAYAFGEKDLRPSFSQQRLTHDERRFIWLEDYRKAHGEEKMGGVTWSWLQAILQQGRKLKRSRELTKISIPLLALLSADDAIVPSAEIEKPLRLPPYVQLKTIPGAWHEVMNEAPVFRDQALLHLANFIKANLFLLK